MFSHKLIGRLFVAAGVAFLLLGMWTQIFGLGLFAQDGPVRLGLSLFNGVLGASLVTAGVRRLDYDNEGGLIVVWGATFLLTCPVILFPLLMIFIFMPMVLAWDAVSGLAQRLPLSWLSLILVAAVLSLIVFLFRPKVFQRHARTSLTMGATGGASRFLSTGLGRCGLAALGPLAWLIVPMLTDMVGDGRLYENDGDMLVPLIFMICVPFGLLTGVLATLWANAGQPGLRLRRHFVAALILVLLPAVPTAALILAK
ncbi:hypothetical protein [Ramlibacter sp. 2FC]|uniref:hypothetical protein n=1 Tax=Ramlibacter sp. 2FC TaxID=2502188 RepID=UPI0010F5CD16|nr:hypothetical protein [Ramlibacter sp. 2FC]